MKRLFLFLLLGVLISCGADEVKIMEKDKFVNVMTDLAYSEVIINLYKPQERDSIRKLITESLLKIHDLERSELDTNLYIYMSDFEKMDQVTQTMIERYDKTMEIETPIRTSDK